MTLLKLFDAGFLFYPGAEHKARDSKNDAKNSASSGKILHGIVPYSSSRWQHWAWYVFSYESLRTSIFLHLCLSILKLSEKMRRASQKRKKLPNTPQHKKSPIDMRISQNVCIFVYLPIGTVYHSPKKSMAIIAVSSSTCMKLVRFMYFLS